MKKRAPRIAHALAIDHATRIVLEDLERRNSAERTIAQYGQSYRKLHDFLKGRGATTLEDVTPELVEAFQLELFDRKNSNGDRLALSTIAQHTAAIRTWGRILSRRGHLPESPTESLEAPKHRRILDEPIPSEKEIQKILHAPDARTPRGYRARAIIELLYGAALRVNELCQLNLDDADLDRAIVIVRVGKAGSSGAVPMGEAAADFIAGYIRAVRDLFVWPGRGDADSRRALFLGLGGERITVGVAEAIVGAVVVKAGLRTRVTPHTFRAAAATHMLQRGADLRTVQEFLRHRSLSSTEHYLRRTVGRTLQWAYRKFHPRNRM